MVRALKVTLAAVATCASFSRAAGTEAFLASTPAPSEEPTQETSAEALCPGTTALKDVVPIAPKCFQNCPHICGPMDEDMIIFYTQEHGKARIEIKKEYCEDQTIWDCMFEETNHPECVKLLQVGNSIGTDPPMTREELETRCEGFDPNATQSGDGDKSPAKDMNPSSEDTNGSQATAIHSMMLAVVAAAVARCLL